MTEIQWAQFCVDAAYIIGKLQSHNEFEAIGRVNNMYLTMEQIYEKDKPKIIKPKQSEINNVKT